MFRRLTAVELSRLFHDDVTWKSLPVLCQLSLLPSSLRSIFQGILFLVICRESSLIFCCFWKLFCWWFSGGKCIYQLINSFLLLSLTFRREVSLHRIFQFFIYYKPAPWAAHGWIAQSQVYFCLCSKTSLCAKLLVWKYMSHVHCSHAWKSSHSKWNI